MRAFVNEASPRSHRVRGKIKALMLSCATIAAAAGAVAPQKARAQAAPGGAFQGTISDRSTFIFGFEGVGGTVVPPPVPGTGVESILGPIGLMGSPSENVAGVGDPSDDSTTSDEEDQDEATDEDSDASVDATLGLISNGPMAVDQPVDEPVTSGSDGGGGDPGGTN